MADSRKRKPIEDWFGETIPPGIGTALSGTVVAVAISSAALMNASRSPAVVPQPVIDVIIADDVILPEITAGLDLDDLQ